MIFKKEYLLVHINKGLQIVKYLKSLFGKRKVLWSLRCLVFV